MIDIEALTFQIKRNCNISDAKYWGTYSICGLLLRLRELYRTEKGIKPWERIPQKEIGEWISEREALWRELEDKDFGDIIIEGNVYGPFEGEKINATLEKENLIYGAGYGTHMKPSFFLADLISKETVEGYDIYMAGREYVRDLSDYPAMLQGKTILARRDTTRLLLWGKFEELRLRGLKGALAFAFSRYGITPDEEPSEDIDRLISLIACSEVEIYIHHELGEGFEGERFGGEWKVFLTHLSCSRAELFARGVKDLLSDTSEKGMLRHIIENRKEGSLGFYIVFLGGYRRLLFPEILSTFERFVETGDWGPIEDARKAGHRKAEEYVERLISIYRNEPDKTQISERIEAEILRGLL
ncbi:MAG: Sfum_1244 family protein [Nitrospirota bacterium]